MMAKLNPVIDLLHGFFFFFIPCLHKVHSIDTDQTKVAQGGAARLIAHNLGVFERLPEGDELIIGLGCSFASCFCAIFNMMMSADLGQYKSDGI